MTIDEAYALLDGIDHLATLTGTALGQLLEASRAHAGVWGDGALDAEIARLAASGGPATMAELGGCLALLAPHLTGLQAALAALAAGWSGADPLTAGEARLLFDAARNTSPPLGLAAVLIGGAVLGQGGGGVPVGATVEVRGRGLRPNPHLVIRFESAADARDAWDFRVASWDGRRATMLGTVPALGIGTEIEVLVGHGTLGVGSGETVEVGGQPQVLGKINTGLTATARCGARGTVTG